MSDEREMTAVEKMIEENNQEAIESAQKNFHPFLHDGTVQPC